MPKKMLILSAALAVLSCPSLAQAQTRVVSLFAPSLDFKDGADRNQYANRVAKVLAEKTGQNWEGQAYARASDFDAARSQSDLIIVDADYFSLKSSGYKPVAMLSSNGATSKRLKLIARKGGANQLYHYKGAKLALVASTNLGKAFVSATILGHEAKADEYFSQIEEVRDVRSAINAVDLGKADLALTFDGYDKGFNTIFTTAPVGLPVIAINTNRVSGPLLEQLSSAASNIKVSTSEIISGASSYNPSDAAAYRRLASERKSQNLNYQTLEAEPAKVSFSVSQMQDRNEGIFFNPFQVQFLPSLDTLDAKLDSKL